MTSPAHLFLLPVKINIRYWNVAYQLGLRALSIFLYF